MSDRSATVLRRIAAELRAELPQIDRTVGETDAALKDASSERVRLYASAALLERLADEIG